MRVSPEGRTCEPLTSLECMWSLVCLSSKQVKKVQLVGASTSARPWGCVVESLGAERLFINTRRGCPSPAPALRKQTQEATTSTSSARAAQICRRQREPLRKTRYIA